MSFYGTSPEFVLTAILVRQQDGRSIPTDIEQPVFVKVCETCGAIVVLEDIHDAWHYRIATNKQVPKLRQKEISNDAQGEAQG